MKNKNLLLTVFALFILFHLLVNSSIKAEISVDHASVIADHQEIIKKNPNAIRAHCDLANAYVDQYISTGKTDKLLLFRAKKSIKKAKALDAKSALPDISWANYFQAMGNKKLALKHAKKAAAVAPGNKAVKRLFAELEETSAAASKNNKVTKEKEQPVIADKTQSGMTAASDVPVVTVTGIVKGDYHVIASYNYPTYFFNSSGIERQVRIVKNADTSATARWKIVPGLADKQGISIESVEHPGYYLRHYDSSISLALNDGSPTFDSDATFFSRAGWADKGMVSFELYNFPGKYIRHHMLILRIDSVNNDSPALLKKDATFNLISVNTKENLTKRDSLTKTPAKKNIPVAQSKPKMIKRNQTLIDKGVIAKTNKPPKKAQISHGTMTMNTDRYGKDYKLIELSKSNPDLCRVACAEDKKCQSWTYVKPGVQVPGARCYLKHSIAQASLNNCCVSGVKLRSAIPKDNFEKSVAPGRFSCTDVYVGAGEEVIKDDLILMCYSSISKNQQIKFSTFSDISFEKSICTPVTYRVGSGQMVKAIELAIQGEKLGDEQMRMPPMRIGGRREIAVRPELAWGKKGIPGRIPPDMSFSFIIEIFDILN